MPISLVSAGTGMASRATGAAGTTRCDGGEVRCEPTLAPGTREEVCNGEDDDCNGVIDDGPAGGGQLCETGEPGVRAQGTIQRPRGERVCVPSVQPGERAEVCDGAYNDCDGLVDNGEPGEPVPETCNGVDDDCDGTVDNRSFDRSSSRWTS